MRKSKVVLDFLRTSIPNKISFGRLVISKMSLIALFVKPDVSFAVSLEIVNKLERYYISSRSGNHEQIALMHQTEKEFDEVFRKLANYVSRIANGDQAVIFSTGFRINKQPNPIDRPEISGEAGDNSGTMRLKRIAVEKATAYVWQFYVGAEVPAENSWLFGGCSTQASFIIKGLTSTTKVWFRVAAVTREGMLPFSHPILRIIH